MSSDSELRRNRGPQQESTVRPNQSRHSKLIHESKGLFEFFTSDTILANKKLQKDYDTNWKAHISIHPDDLEKAWEVIFPILCDITFSNPIFKVINRQSVNETLEETRANIIITNNNVQGLSSQPQTNRSLQELKLAILKLNKYKEKEEQIKRFHDGTQITIYMRPGEEKQYQTLFEEIENALKRDNIRPGTIYDTDRPIGRYTSVRHPGKKYQAATIVADYNPDKFPDPFAILNTYDNAFQFAFLNTLKNGLMNDINVLKKATGKNLKIKTELATTLKALCTNFFSMSVSDQVVQLSTFTYSCMNEIDNADKNLKYDSEWSIIAKHIIGCFFILPMVVLIPSLYTRMKTGQYIFFDEKPHVSVNLDISSYREKIRTMRAEGAKSDTQQSEVSSETKLNPS